MESLIRIRYLFDTLQPDEQAEAIKRIAVECGTQWIMTLISNHFARGFHHHSEDKPMIAAIIKEISSVIVDRKSKAQSHDIEASITDESDTECNADASPVSIEDIPSVMISKIASYLTQNDYIHFMHSSRRILIGCHSPSALYHLNVHHGNYKARGVTAASSVRSLALNDITQLDVLQIAGKYPNNSNIERLSVSAESDTISQLFGNIFPLPVKGRVRDRDFLQFIKSFSGAKCIDILSPVSLCYASWTENDIPTMPALKGTVYHSRNGVMTEIQRSLIRKHETQIESLKLMYHSGVRNEPAPDVSLSNLTELKLVHKSPGHLTRDVLFEWIRQIQGIKLRIISVDCSRVFCVPELVTFLIGHQPDLQFMEFVFEAMDRNLIALLIQIGKGLLNSKLVERRKVNENEELRLRIRYRRNWMVQREEETESAELFFNGLSLLAQVFEGCNVRHFMVQAVLRLVDCPKISKDQNLDGLVMKLREEYRVDTYCESRAKSKGDEWCVVICNKDNPMKGGYGAHGLFVE